MQSGRVNRPVIALGVGIPLAILAGIVLLGGGESGNDAAPTTVAPASTTSLAVDQEWNDALGAALQPLSDVLPRYAADVDAWSNGERSSTELTATLDELEPVLGRVRDALDDLGDHPHDGLARPLVAHSIELYTAAFTSHRLAIDAAGDVATQYDLLGRRLRILGDRAFDRARDRTAAPLDSPDGVTLNLPAEVPDWTRLGLAVGPPLEAVDTNDADALPRQRTDERASQATEDWVSAVDDLDVPTIDDIRAMLDDPDASGGIARRLTDAAEELRGVPVPDGDRGRADRVALGWLILADAARAGQLSGQLSGLDGDTPALAETLLAIGDAAEFQTG